MQSGIGPFQYSTQGRPNVNLWQLSVVYRQAKHGLSRKIQAVRVLTMSRWKCESVPGRILVL